jgi:stearoyl-CoA desaturase (Delta-9 desaturase)
MLEISLTVSVITIATFFVLHWYSSLFMQSFFHHRYAAHMQFTISKFWQKIFYLISYVTQGSSYLSPRAYGIMHRLHHAHTDTNKDPHSPANDHSIYRMMWKTKLYYDNIFKGRMEIDKKYLKNLPDWKLFDKMGHSWISRALWISAYTLFYVCFATQWWMYIILPLHFVMGPFHGVIINWFAHKTGYRNFSMSNTSTNLFNIDLLMWGESLHNNHHKNPANANFARRWFEFDPMYPFIILMNRLRIIRLKSALQADLLL